MGAACGLTDFLRLFGDDEPSFSLVAYRGAPGMATAIIADTYGPASVVEHADVRADPRDGAGERNGSPADLIAVVAACDSEWSVVLHSIGRVGADELVALPDEARDLSESLGTDALVLSADDGSAGYELYRDGELVERAMWDDADGYSHFESERGGARHDDASGLEPARALVRELGLRIPHGRPCTDGVESWLASVEPAAIERVDLLDMAGSQLVGEDAIREASTDAFPRPSMAQLMAEDSAVDVEPPPTQASSSLRGVLLRWVGKVLGD